MHRIFRVKAYEMEHGPHFNEEHARKAVMKMENEDGTRGPHWSLEETSDLASQYGISLSGKFNRYDWFVALNMVYSDYYKVLLNITGSNNIKHYIEFAKAWLNDKDIDEGKMWYYYQYVMCDKIREAEMECYINSVQTALNTINTGVSQIACDTKLASCEVINAITSGNASLASQLASCCCDVRSSIADVNNNITKMGYESQLSMCNQTNTLQSAITSGFNSLLSDNTTKFNILGSKIDAQTQIINDKFCQLEMREMQNKIDALRQVTQVSNVYEEPLPPGQFPMPNQQRKKLVDITIQCNGESKKFTIPENKSTITDSTLGLTISTNKQEIINIVRSQYDTYKQRKEAIAKCDEEMAKCQQLLDKLEIHNEPTNENSKIVELQNEINELKNIIRKANQMVPPPMKDMLPQDMKDAMNKVDQ